MIQIQNGKIFKNEYKDFLKYYKYSSDLEKKYTNIASIDFLLDTESIEKYNINYFKAISINKFINEKALNYDENVTNTFENRKSNISDLVHPNFLNSKMNLNLGNIQNKITSLLGSDKSFEKTSKKIIENHTKKRITEKLITLNKEQINNGYFKIYFDLLYPSNLDENEKSKYDFYVYAYDNDNNIIDKKIILSQDVQLYVESELYSQSDSIDIEVDNNALNDFNISFKKDLNIEQSRNIMISFGNNLSKYLKYFDSKQKHLIEKITIMESYKGNIIQRFVIEEDIEKLSDVTFNNFIKAIKDSKLEYNIIVEFYNRKNVTKSISINIDEFYIKNESNEVINDQNMFLNKIKDFHVEYLEKEKLIEVILNFYNLELTKYFDPQFKSIIINGKNYIDKCYIEKNKVNKISLENKDIKNTVKDNIIKFCIDVVNIEKHQINNIKIVVKKLYNSQEVFNLEKEIKIIYNNDSTGSSKLEIIQKNENLEIQSEYTNYVFKYNWSINNSLKSYDIFKTQNSELEGYLSTQYSQILSDDKKDEISNNIQLNKYFIIIKKNSTTPVDEYIQSFQLELLDNNYLFAFIDNSNISGFKEKVSINEKYKKIYFEAKIFAIPHNLFIDQNNDFKINRKIKEVILLNDLKIIPDENKINQIRSILKKINFNGIESISNIEKEILYNNYCFNFSHAKSNDIVVEKKVISKSIEKTVYANDEILNLKYSKEKNKIYLDIDFNIEELLGVGLKKENIVIEFNKLISSKKISFSKFYLRESIEKYLEFYENLLINKNQYSYESYNSLIKEINSYCDIVIENKSKNIITLKIEIDLKKCPNLFSFLLFCKNIQKNINSKNELNINNNIYQKLNMSSFKMINLDLNTNNTFNIDIKFNKNDLLFKYFDITSF